MKHSCYECLEVVIFDNPEKPPVRVYTRSPRAMQAAFLLCSEACAKKLCGRLEFSGWSDISVRVGECFPKKLPLPSPEEESGPMPEEEKIIPRPYPAGTRYGIAKREDIKW